MSLTLSSIEDRIKSYETAIANALANVHGLSGGLNELKSLMAIVAPVVEAIDPAVAPIIGVAETVIDTAETVTESVSEAMGNAAAAQGPAS